MGWKDVVLYLALLLVCAIVITLVIWALGKLFRAIGAGRKKAPKTDEAQDGSADTGVNP